MENPGEPNDNDDDDGTAGPYSKNVFIETLSIGTSPSHTLSPLLARSRMHSDIDFENVVAAQFQPPQPRAKMARLWLRQRFLESSDEEDVETYIYATDRPTKPLLPEYSRRLKVSVNNTDTDDTSVGRWRNSMSSLQHIDSATQLESKALSQKLLAAKTKRFTRYHGVIAGLVLIVLAMAVLWLLYAFSTKDMDHLHIDSIGDVEVYEDRYSVMMSLQAFNPNIKDIVIDDCVETACVDLRLTAQSKKDGIIGRAKDLMQVDKALVFPSLVTTRLNFTLTIENSGKAGLEVVNAFPGYLLIIEGSFSYLLSGFRHNHRICVTQDIEPFRGPSINQDYDRNQTQRFVRSAIGTISQC